MAKILVQANSVSKSFGGNPLYKEVHFSIFENEKIALYGPNGSGKSTLFKLIVDELETSSGELHKATGLRVSYLRQSHKAGLEYSLNDYISIKEPELNEWDIKRIGAGLGLSEDLYQKQLQELSGGYRMRFYLACELAREPELLLLDEPTNHLDLESVLFLESYLKNYKGSFVLISHDRELLENICNTCLVIEDAEVLKYRGSLSAYFAYSEEQKLLIEKQNKKLEEKKKHLESFVEKFRAKASKAKQAQSKIKQISKLGEIHNQPIAYFQSLPIPKAHATGKRVLEAKCESGLSYDANRVILKSFDFHLFRGDKVAIVGENGAGKTTLLKFLAKKLKSRSGEDPSYYKNVEASYFAQHLEQELPLETGLLNYVNSKIPKDIPEQEILNLLGAMGFREHDLEKKLSLFSGGERMRIVLAEILLRKNPLLLLDEPTNHLDFETVESLSKALKQTDCTVVLVSHDRSFVDQVCDQIFEIKDHQVRIYPGTYQEYVWSKQNKDVGSQEDTSLSSSQASQSGEKSKKFNYKEERKRLEKAIKAEEKKQSELESKLESLENKILSLNEKLPKAGEEVSTLILELNALSSEKVQCEEDLLLSLETSEELQANLDLVLS